jgi:lambda repressor-like predicted transcriptional regulator
MAQQARYSTTRIEREMAERGLDRAWLAKAAGVSQVTLSFFFRGTRQTVKVGSAIARALGHEPGYFLMARRAA